MKLIEIVHSLRRAKGTNAKLDVLILHKNNELWKKFLVYTLNMRQTYGVSAPSANDFQDAEIDERMFLALDQLASRVLTGKSAKEQAKELSREYGEIPRLILGRSIKAGVSVKTVNKAYPDLIKEFVTMKGKDIPFKHFPLMASVKFDGVKVFVKVTTEYVKLMSSSGSEFQWQDLKKEFIGAVEGMYEGELIYREGKQCHRSTISGKLNSLLSGNSPDMTSCSYQIYDFIPLLEWELKRSSLAFKLRQRALQAQFDNGFQDSAYVCMVEHTPIAFESEAIRYYEYMIENGYEGGMFRYLATPYEFTGDKRTDNLIKKKAIKECVLKCVSVKPHSNPAKGITGALNCEGEVDGDFIKVSVGSGLSKYDIMQEAEHFMYKDIEILYNTKTVVNGKHSLFLPRFKRIVKGQ